MTLRNLAWILGLALGVALVGCRTPQGRIMGTEEEDYVGARAAGSATYDRLIEATVSKLLARQDAAGRGLGKLRVAFAGVENKSAEDLGDFRDHIYQIIDTAVENSGRYRTISRRFVTAALREANLRTDELFIPRHQRAFASVLETSGNPVEFLLFATLTSGTTRGESVKQRDYMLTLALVDLKTGEPDKEATRLRKAYTR